MQNPPKIIVNKIYNVYFQNCIDVQHLTCLRVQSAIACGIGRGLRATGPRVCFMGEVSAMVFSTADLSSVIIILVVLSHCFSFSKSAMCSELPGARALAHELYRLLITSIILLSCPVE